VLLFCITVQNCSELLTDCFWIVIRSGQNTCMNFKNDFTCVACGRILFSDVFLPVKTTFWDTRSCVKYKLERDGDNLSPKLHNTF
jgi:hypothetical protein